MSITGVLMYLAVATAPETPAEQLGAVTSAIAFVDLCSSLEDAHKHLDGAKPEEAALVGVSAQFCTGMIQSVAMTVAATPDFRIGETRVCVSDDLAPSAVVEEMAAMIRQDRNQFVGRPTPDVQTPTAILGAIHRLSPCAASN